MNMTKAALAPEWGMKRQPSPLPMAPSDLLEHEMSVTENNLINALALQTLLWDSRNPPPAERHWALPGTLKTPSWDQEAVHGTDFTLSECVRGLRWQRSIVSFSF